MNHAPPEVLQETILRATSPCKAWYRLRLLRLVEGFVVEKTCGSSRSRGQYEAWFRRCRPDAEKLFANIVLRKSRGRRGRNYRQEAESSGQLSLFQ